MQALLQNKKVLIGGGVAVIVFVGYFFFGGGGGSAPSFQVTDGSSAAPTNAGPVGTPEAASLAASIEQELITELLNLKNITLDRSPLESEAYKSLQDFSRPIDPEPAGRPNPFLPYDAPPATTGGTTGSPR